jgi:hypothetical protein
MVRGVQVPPPPPLSLKILGSILADPFSIFAYYIEDQKSYSVDTVIDKND